MSARDDYPEAAGPTLSAYVRQHGAMCDEIDRLRSAYDALVTEAAAEHQRLVTSLAAEQVGARMERWAAKDAWRDPEEDET